MDASAFCCAKHVCSEGDNASPASVGQIGCVEVEGRRIEKNGKR